MVWRMADNQRCCRTELSLQQPARGQEERGDGAGVALTSVGVQHRLLWQVPDLHAADESEQSAPGTGPAAGQPGWGHSPEVPAAADGLGAAGQDGHRRRDVIVLVFTELVDDEGFLLVQLPQLHGAWGAGGDTTHLRASTHLSGGHPPRRWGGRWAPRGGGMPVAYRSRRPPGCPCHPPSAGRRRPPPSGRRRCRSPRWGRGGGRRRPRGSRSSSARSAPRRPAAGPRLRERRGEKRPGERPPPLPEGPGGPASPRHPAPPLPRAGGPATCAVVRALQVPLHAGGGVGRDVPLRAGRSRGLLARRGRRGLLGRRLLHGGSGGGGSGAGGAPTCSRAARARHRRRRRLSRERPPRPRRESLARVSPPPSWCGGGRRSPGRRGSCRCLPCPAMLSRLVLRAGETGGSAVSLGRGRREGGCPGRALS